MPYIRQTENGVLLSVKARPNRPATRIISFDDDAVYIDIAAVPDKNKANKELVCCLEKLLGTGKGSVALVSGEKSHNKVVAVRGAGLFDIVQRAVESELNFPQSL